MQKFKMWLSGLAILVLAGCSTVAPEDLPPVQQADIAELTASLLALGPDIDPEEAARAARIAYNYPRRLAVEYQISDAPLVHNIKVNQGLRPRGLCYQWADDMEARLRQEGFETLDLHRAIANADNAILIEHSTVIASRRGGTMPEGIVLDPWRNGGLLYWSPVLEDEKYRWILRADVFEMKRRRQVTRQRWAN